VIYMICVSCGYCGTEWTPAPTGDTQECPGCGHLQVPGVSVLSDMRGMRKSDALSRNDLYCAAALTGLIPQLVGLSTSGRPGDTATAQRNLAVAMTLAKAAMRLADGLG